MAPRAATEHPEAVHACTARLVGTDMEMIMDTMTALLDDAAVHGAMPRATNPFGDGCAAELIADHLVRTFMQARSLVSQPVV